MRILSAEEMTEVWDSGRRSEDDEETALFRIARIQDAKTYKAALQEVGECLEKESLYKGTYCKGWHIISNRTILSLLKGELP